MKDQLDGLITEMLDRGLLFEEATKEFEKQFIMKCLERSGGNRTQTAKKLGIPPQHPSKKALPLQPLQPPKKSRSNQKTLDSIGTRSYYQHSQIRSANTPDPSRHC